MTDLIADVTFQEAHVRPMHSPFYSLGNEVDKGRSRTASLIYKSIVIGSTDKFSTAILAHLFRPLCVDKSST